MFLACEDLTGGCEFCWALLGGETILQAYFSVRSCAQSRGRIQALGNSETGMFTLRTIFIFIFYLSTSGCVTCPAGRESVPRRLGSLIRLLYEQAHHRCATTWLDLLILRRGGFISVEGGTGHESKRPSTFFHISKGTRWTRMPS